MKRKEKGIGKKAARESAANDKCGNAAKRSTQPKAGRTGAKPAPAAGRGRAAERSQGSRSTNGANAQSPRAARTVKPPKGETVTEAENPQERQSIIQRLIAWLRAVLSFKKGERDEFRYNYDEHHPAYEFKEENGKAVTFGVTHSAETFGIKNMPLEVNPDPNDSRDAYIRNGVISTKTKNLSRKRKDNWKLSDKDKPSVKSKRRYHEKEVKRKAVKQKENKKNK